MSEGQSFVNVIKAPVVSEKSYGFGAQGRYVFRCHPHATKIDIKRAIEEAFDHKIHVVDVNTINMRSKKKTRSRRDGGRVIGKTASWKKAIITLAAGEKIDNLYENV
jgi:large subunit ribosomal protein L23